jgi:diphthine-ammonia ligase
MNLGVLFSGGKDSAYAAYLAKRAGNSLACLISINSNNPNSFMFHTPSVSQVVKQAKSMGLPIVLRDTKGEKEIELADLKIAIKESIDKYKIEGIVTGAVESVYQASRVQGICNELGIECFNPLWQKDQIKLLEELVGIGAEIVITGVFAYPLNEKFLGRKIDKNFINEFEGLREKYQINPAGEGGEFESFVLYFPDLFKEELRVRGFEDIKEGENSWRRNYDIGN